MQRLCQRYDGIGGTALEKTSLQEIEEKITDFLLTLYTPPSYLQKADDLSMGDTVISAHEAG